MKLRSIFLLMLVLVTGAAQAGSVKHKVFCSNENGSKWEWLPDTYYKHQAVIMYRSSARSNAMMYKARAKITRKDYNEFVAMCQNYFPDLPHPQPGFKWSRHWFVYSIFEDGRFIDMPGRFDTFGVLNYNNNLIN